MKNTMKIPNNYRSLAGALIVVVAIGLAFPTPTHAGTQSGWDKYQEGDFMGALAVWKPLAMKGDAGAQFNVGVMYNDGRGVEQDRKVALKWWSKAADNGDGQAQHNLAQAYANGLGVEKNYEKAVALLKTAAKKEL